MAIKGLLYAINGHEVTTPDEEVWQNVVIGENLAGNQRRSPYKTLQWTKQVASPCYLDWFDYDNQTLTSLTTRPPGELDEHETYTDAICKSVVFRQRLNVGNEIVATFEVYVG